jgi:ATP-dependent Clp protease ATP-binding subunit ClpA
MGIGKDDKTRDLLGGAIRQRGRPVTGSALTPAQRQARRREKLKEQGVGVLTVSISVDLLDRLDEFVRFKDVTKDAVVERLLRGQLMRKR